MKDNFEEFVRKNRESFDYKEPGDQLWDSIERSLPAKKRKLIPWRSMSIAAGFLILLGLIGNWAYQQGIDEGRVSSLAEISSEYEEMEKHYQSQIKNKLALLASVHQDEDVKKDIQEMESFLEELKQDLKDTPKQEREVVVQAMIENYRARLEILERVLDRLPKNSTQQKNIKDETKSI